MPEPTTAEPTRMSEERAALLRCRYAGRYDDLMAGRAGYPEDEALDEQAAASVVVPRSVYSRLIARGLVAYRGGGGLRLTQAGRDALAAEDAERRHSVPCADCGSPLSVPLDVAAGDASCAPCGEARHGAVS